MQWELLLPFAEFSLFNSEYKTTGVEELNLGKSKHQRPWKLVKNLLSEIWRWRSILLVDESYNRLHQFFV